MGCPECGNENRQGARFCDSCGAALEGPAPAPAPAPASAREPGPGELPDELAGGRYTPERFLGQGGRKRVFLARGAGDERPVAVAVFETAGVGEAVLARARREAQAMGKLGEHPHIVAIVESGEDRSGPYIVSEHMPGGDVAGLLAASDGNGLEIERAVGIAVDVCRALEHAHGCGIIHRDLKPANVWLGEGGHARLGDFGLALTGEGRSRADTGLGLVGTVAYLPPEQALGRTSDARSDLYSLGALLYEMLTGQPPFPGDDAVAIMGQHLSAAPVPPSKLRAEVSADLDAIVLELLAKRPEERPGNAAEVRRRLEAADLSPPDAEDAAAAEENPLDRLAGGIFVGREPELAALRTAVDEARGGSGGLVLLVGEPGIGKTRTAEEVATYAQVQGARVHWGRCHEGEGAPAYWPWAEAIRSYVRAADPVGLAWELGSGAAEIARIVPELRERLGDVGEAADAEAEEARFRLFDAAATFLGAASRSRPLVIVLDDLHWADEPSLLLLRFLARGFGDSPLLIVGTYRDVELGRHHPLARTLSELAGAERTTRVHLRGLGEDAVERYIEMSTGQAPAPGLAAAVLEQTEGNPFFVAEVVRLLASEGRLESPVGGAGAWRPEIPQGVREVVGRRLDMLSEEANAVLSVAAATGREFGVEVLERSCDACSAETIQAALEEATAARIIAPVDRALRRYSFSHALVRETLYAEIPPTRRGGVHSRIAEAIEEVHGDDPAQLSSLAHHALEAASGQGSDRVAKIARRAARQATERLAHEDAVSLLERAGDVLELDPESDRALELEVRLELGEALTKASRYEDARTTLEGAAAIARELGDDKAFARAACDVAVLSETGELDRGIVALVTEALEGAGASDDSLRSRLLSALAAEYYWEDPVGKAEPLSAEALELARRVGDDGAIAHALIRRQFTSGNDAEGTRQRLAEADEIFELGVRMADPELEVRAHAYRIRAYLELGDLAGVDREIDAYDKLATRLRQPQHLWHAPLLRATRAMIDGRFAEAERLGAEALAGGERAGEPLAQQFYAIQTALRMRLQGREAEIRDVVEQMADRYPAVPAWRCALASIEAQLGNLDAARQHFERIAARGFDRLPYDAQRLIALALLADACAVLGDSRRAAELFELLDPYDGLNLVAGRAAASYGPVGGVLGRLARVMGRVEEAERRLEGAIELCDRMGERPLKASHRHELAALLLDRGREGDRERALELLERALDTARELGMPTLVERALALRLEAQGLAGVDVTTSIDSMIEAVADERPDLSAHVNEDGTVTILFSDIENSTLMTERLGDERWLEVLRAHNTVFRRRLREHHGFEVKSQGDGFMLVFRAARAALACATEIQRDLERAEAGESERIRVRMGIHVGQAIREEGDLFGRSVILAARIAAQASGGEILVSESLRQAAEEAGDGFAFDDGRELELKGLAGRHRVFRAEWEDAVPA